jgi:hypothetical protein
MQQQKLMSIKQKDHMTKHLKKPTAELEAK